MVKDRTFRNGIAGIAIFAVLLSSAFSIAGADDKGTVSEIDGYQTWVSLVKDLQVDPVVASRCIHPPFEGHPGTEHAPLFVSVFANETANAKIAGARKDDFRSGSIVIKEKRKSPDQKEADDLGVMIKRSPGFDPANGDWEFLYISGKRVARGPSELKSCYSCHAGASRMAAKNSDYVFIDRYLDRLSKGLPR